MGETIGHFTGRAKFAGLGGMIQFFEFKSDAFDSVFYENIDERLRYILVLLENWFSLIHPQPKDNDFLTELLPGKKHEYYHIMTTSIKGLFPLGMESLVSMLSECLFSEDREDAILQGCSSEQVKKHIKCFVRSLSRNDRDRINEQQLYWLVLFVYDYCNCFFSRSVLDARIMRYMDDHITISGKDHSVSKAEHSAIIDYLKHPLTITTVTAPNGERHDILGPKFNISFTDHPLEQPHLKDSPTYKSVMFIDLLHKFFLSFGIEKRQYKGEEAEFSKAERELIFNLLIQLKLYRSDKNAEESKLITVLFNKYRTYLQELDILAWIRCNEYSDLLPLPADDVFDGNLSRLEREGQVNYSQSTPEKYDDILSDICGYEVDSDLIFGHPFICRKAIPERMCAYVELKKEERSAAVIPGGELEYIYQLLVNKFSYFQILPFSGQTMIARYPMADQEIFSHALKKIERDYLNRVNTIVTNPFLIPGFSTNREGIRKALESALRDLSPSDQDRIDITKMFNLVLFVSDYCTQVFCHASTHPIYNRITWKTVLVDKIKITTTIEAIGMVEDYLSRPVEQVSFHDDKIVFGPRDGALYTQSVRTYVTHKRGGSKNVITMFCDLFRAFFQLLGTDKREGAGVSKAETWFLAEMLNALGFKRIKYTTVSSYLADNKDYYLDCKLYEWWRDNEYSNLFLNDYYDSFIEAESGASSLVS